MEPRTKLEVMDEMVNVFGKVSHEQDYCELSYNEIIKIALQAVFDMINASMDAKDKEQSKNNSSLDGKIAQKIIKDFVEMIEEEYDRVVVNFYGDSAFKRRIRKEELVNLRQSPKYQALKALVEKGVFYTATCPDCNFRVIECQCNIKHFVTADNMVQEGDNEGWIKCNGETPIYPLMKSAKFEIRLRNGKILPGKYAYNWEHGQKEDDIIAYRIVKEEPKKEPEGKRHRLSEMWKVWYRPDRKGRAREDELDSQILTGSLENAKHWIGFNEIKVIAITPADATSFYAGEGLE